MTTLMSLSDEVIDIILSYSDISFEDIINFRCVCKKFQWAAKKEKYCFLERKFFQRWSSAKKYYDEQSKENEQKQSEENKQKDKKPISFIETGIIYVKQLRYLMSRNMLVFLSIVKLASEEMFDNEHYIKILIFMDEIKHLLDQPVRVGCDLTDRYCCLKVFYTLRIDWRKHILYRYIEEQPYKELSEESAITWAQQLQLEKNISYSSVKASLKSIALEAMNFLREKHPEHSIFSTPDEYFSHWENSNIDDNYWREAEGTQIMDTLKEYMFGKLKFRVTCSSEMEYACIDYVLENKYGNDIILYIIYESVARRLGLRCDFVQSLYEFHSLDLFWMPKYTFPTDYKEDICLLDEENKKNMKCIQLIYCNRPQKLIYKNYTFRTREIYKKTPTEMLKSIMNSESSCDLENYPSTLLIYQLKQFMPERRSQDVKFAVGMIVTHGDDSKDCSTGVIIGWLPICSKFMSNIDVTSIINMPLKMCSYFNAEQTYYIVLTKNVKLCYVKEDDITLTKPMWIRNKKIYHYFCKFEGTHYVPNEELAEVYPHDTAIAAGTIFNG